MDHQDVIALREAVVDMIVNAINDHDLSHVAEVFTEDVVYDMIPTGELFTGLESVTQMLTELFTAFPDTHLVKYRQAVTPTLGFIEFDFSGTMVSAFHKIEAPEPPYVLVKKPGVIVLEFTPDAKVRRWTDYWDMAIMLRQIGGSL